MCNIKEKVFVVYKEYRNWEDKDCNGAEIIATFKNKNNAINKLNTLFNSELQFFSDNYFGISQKNCSKTSFFINTVNGDVEGYIVESEVN